MLALLEQHGILRRALDEVWTQIANVNKGDGWEGAYFSSLQSRRPPAMNNPDRGVAGWLSVRRCCSDSFFTRESIVPVRLAGEKLPQHVEKHVFSLLREVDMRGRGGYKGFYEKELEQQKASDKLSVRLVEVKKAKAGGNAKAIRRSLWWSRGLIDIF